MKRRFLILFMAMLSLVCCKPELDFVDGSLRAGRAEAMMSSGNVSLNFPSESGSASVDLKASGAWTASFVNDRAKDWCSLSTSEGQRGTATITVSVKDNTDYDDRSASISFVCGDLRRTINVTQKQKDAILVTGNRFDLGPNGGSITVEVKANVAFEATVSEGAKSWITQKGTKALSTKVLTFEVAANDGMQKREGEITISSPAGTEVVKVYQEGSQPTIVLSQNQYEIAAEGGQIRVDVQSNVDVALEIPSDCDWVWETSTKAMSTSTFYLTVDENESFVERSCRIKFRAAAWGIAEEVTVRQKAGEPQVIIGTGVYEFEAEGGDLSIDVQSNFGITAVVPDTCAWIRAVKTKALTTKTFHFEIEPNDSEDERQGVILFTNESLGITEQVIVRQRERNGVFVTERDFDIPAEGGTFEVKIRYNAEYSLYVEPGWVHELETKAMMTDVHRFAVDTNDSLYPREGFVYVFHAGGTDTVFVRQPNLPHFIKIVSPESRELSWEGGTLEVLFEHDPNGFRDVQVYFDNLNSAMVGDNYVFAVGARSFKRMDSRHTLATCPYTRNGLRRERKAFMVYSNYDRSTCDTAWFTQPPVTILTSDTEVTLPQAAGTFSFRVAGMDPGQYRLETPAWWLEQTGVSTKNGELEYRWKATENTYRAMREDDIKIYRTDGGWPDVFHVRQEGSGLSVSVTYTGNRVTAPAVHGRYWNESVIYWGDGNSRNYVENASHTYSSSGTHTVTVTSQRMQYIDWAEVSSFQNGMKIDFSKMH